MGIEQIALNSFPCKVDRRVKPCHCEIFRRNRLPSLSDSLWAGKWTRAGKFAAVLNTLAIVLASNPVFATQNGGQSYPAAVNTFLPGIAPPPGQTWWQNYSGYYSADTFKDGKGNPLVPDFKLEVAVYGPRAFHSWKAQIGPFGLASAIVVPLVYVGSHVALRDEHDTAIGDPTLQPLYLTYSNDARNFFAYGGMDFFVPTYSSVSQRYVSADPIVTMTWFPTKGVDLNMIGLLELPLEETESTNYRSGNLLVVEFSGHIKPLSSMPLLSVGVAGLSLNQFSGDKVGGVDIGFEGEAFTIGPEIIYQIGKAGGFAFKWQPELNVRNRPQGDKFWFQFQVPLGGG